MIIQTIRRSATILRRSAYVVWHSRIAKNLSNFISTSAQLFANIKCTIEKFKDGP